MALLRWSAERGPGRPGTGWSRVAGATEVKECACRRSIHPSSGGRNCCCRDGRRQSPWARRRTRKRRHMRRDAQTRAQQRAAGTNNTALFDIVNRDDGQRFASRAATSHASCARPLSCPGRAQRDPGPRSDTATLQPAYCAARVSRWVPGLVPFGFASLHSTGTRDRRAALIPPARDRAACAFWRRSCARRTPRHRRIGRRPAGCANRSGETGRPGHRCRRSMSSAA